MAKYGESIFQAAGHCLEGAIMDKASVEIDARWAKVLRSPVYFIIVALQGISVTFAPLFLYWSGKGSYFGGLEWLVVPLCFAVIFLVPGFYFWLGSSVIRQLRQK
jgi:hypothetical protein